MDTQKLLFASFLCLILFKLCNANDQLNPLCAPSSCGNIHNISYPFRLKSDPQGCGVVDYELSCENNSTLVLYLDDQVSKLIVKTINYENYTMRVADPGIDEHDCSSLPRFLISTFDNDRYRVSFVDREGFHDLAETITFIKCLNPVNSSIYLEIMSSCVNGVLLNSSFSSKSSSIFNYVQTGLVNGYYDLRENCSVEMTTMIPVREFDSKESSSFVEIHRQMAYGFEITWYEFYCRKLNCPRRCYPDRTQGNQFGCVENSIGFHRSALYAFREYYWTIRELFDTGFNRNTALFNLKLEFQTTVLHPIYQIIYTLNLLVLFLFIRNLCVTPLIVTFLIYKWRRRHLSDYYKIEEFLQSQNNLMPIRYSFSNIKKITGGFKEELGKGGFGSVYKGKLRSRQLAAIKILENSKTNGEDFINEVATIGKIHHANVVQLIGFCCERSKFALIYEFMPNGSLDNHIVFRQGSNSLSWEKLHEIAMGVARGIEYLHQGCEMQILHFDIKPHNILLDENFNAKISDFGLAKFYQKRDNTVSLTAAKGTIGYMAPELFYKNIGGISYKADVYSFGMLLLEMTGKRKNLNALLENSGESYYKSWVYEQVFGEKFALRNTTEEENEIARKLIVIGLWCIQMQPSNRPAMNKVVEMLEGDLESLQLPPIPLQYTIESIQSTDMGSSWISQDFTDPFMLTKTEVSCAESISLIQNQVN